MPEKAFDAYDACALFKSRRLTKTPPTYSGGGAGKLDGHTVSSYEQACGEAMSDQDHIKALQRYRKQHKAFPSMAKLRGVVVSVVRRVRR